MFRALGVWVGTVALATSALAQTSFVNPLTLSAGSLGPGGNCADPTVLQSVTGGDTEWYMVCTSDALGDNDRNAQGGLNYHFLPIWSSSNLVDWTYRGDVFALPPSWHDLGAQLWAPELKFFNGKYYLYYSVTSVRASVSGEPNCGSDSAIGVATANSLLGPWVDRGSPVVAPRRAGSGCNFQATIDPEVVIPASGSRLIFYGSFTGGIEARTLSSDGFTAPPATTVSIAIAGRYEAAEVLQRDGWYWLFLSANNCCNGPLTGYVVYAARSSSPTGPFLDREGVGLTIGRAGGTPVLTMNGNDFVGPGHISVLTDHDQNDWVLYHAVRESDPYFAGSVGYTKRPVLLDRIDWSSGWPQLRGRWGPLDCVQSGPAAQLGQVSDALATRRPEDVAAGLVWGDDFDGSALDAAWQWVRPPAASQFSVAGGEFRFATQSGDLHLDQNNASVLRRALPSREWMVEARVAINLPADGCCLDYAQGGLVIYQDDDNYLKLVHVSIGATRQLEWAKELAPVAAGYPRYGGSLVATPAEWTWLRVVRRLYGDEQHYTAWSSRNGIVWERGSTWRHRLGTTPSIGLVSMSRSGFTTRFDWVRVFQLTPIDCVDPQYADACDRDADGSGDACDGDDDGDGAIDSTDCAPREAESGRPPDPALQVVGDATLSWNSTPSADRWDLSRAALTQLGPGQYGACLVDDLAATQLNDPSRPTSGEGFGYLVRAVDLGCGAAGSWGLDSTSAERINLDPMACP
jgi:arabinan endo-1,5-alpha-L-arabinosidase